MSEVRIPWAGWELREQLGSGGFGTVYRIENPGTGEQSAMKVLSLPKDASEINALRVEGYDNPSIAGIYQNQLNKIINEYSLMAQMKGHANIVRSEDCTAAPHTVGLGWDVYIRMELLYPLTRYLMSHSLDESEVIRLGMDLCCALVLCEQKNIIHRDIKPENIFLSEYGVYKLGDFGIARTMDHTTMATHAGSYRYMAPEVYKNERYGKEVDIYSLGLTLYWLLNNRRMPFLPTDRPPRASENEQALQMRLSGTPVPPPVNGSEALKAVVMKACAYDPRDRFRTAEEMLRALETVRDGTATAPEYGYGSANPAGAQQTADNLWHDSDETVGSPRTSPRSGKASPNTEETVGREKPKRKAKAASGERKNKTNQSDNVLRPEPSLTAHPPKEDKKSPKGSQSNPFVVMMKAKKAAEGGMVSLYDNGMQYDVMMPPWPLEDEFFSFVASDGNPIYVKFSLDQWTLIAAGLLTIAAILCLFYYQVSLIYLLAIGVLVYVLHFAAISRYNKKARQHRDGGSQNSQTDQS